MRENVKHEINTTNVYSNSRILDIDYAYRNSYALPLVSKRKYQTWNSHFLVFTKVMTSRKLDLSGSKC